MDVEKIYTYQEKVDYLLKQIATQTKTYGDLIEVISGLEREVKRSCMDWLLEHPDNKKVALEKVEMMSADTPEKKEHYLHLVYLRHKKDCLEKVLEGTASGLSAIQSLMKYERSVNYTGGVE